MTIIGQKLKIDISLLRNDAEWLIRLLEMNETAFRETSVDKSIVNNLRAEALFQSQRCKLMIETLRSAF